VCLSKCHFIDKLEESDIIEELYHGTYSEKKFSGSHVSSEDSQGESAAMNWTGEA
jgi:hypothetical protein